MKAQTKKTIPIVSYKPAEKRLTPQSRQKEEIQQDLVRVTTDAPLKVFEEGIVDISYSLDASFKRLTSHEYSGMALDEVEVSLEVTAEGKVGILGNGVSASGSSSIKLTFRRK